MRTPMGIRGSRAGGTQPGSIYLADQKLPITVSGVRDVHAKTELPLTTDAQLQTPWARDVGLYRRVLAGVSARASTKPPRRPCLRPMD